MFEYKIILGYLSTIVAFIAYTIYFKQIFANKIKPHAFSWLIWGLLMGIAFAASVSKGGGAGSWMIGFSTVVCFIIFVVALFKGVRKFAFFDWLLFAVALLALLLWQLTKEPLISVILVTIADSVAGLPTLRKAYYQPNEDSVSLFSLNSFKFFVALFALESFSLSTWLYPASLVFSNGLIVIMLLVRRRQLK